MIMIPDQDQQQQEMITMSNQKLHKDGGPGGVITMAAGKGSVGQENGGGGTKSNLLEGGGQRQLQDARLDPQTCSRTSTPSSVSPSQPNASTTPPALSLSALFASAAAAAAANQAGPIPANIQQTQVPSNSNQIGSSSSMTATTTANNISNLRKSSSRRSPSADPDVSPFPGKIVYNPDGSAYIIEDSNSSLEFGSELQDIPRLASAHYLAKSTPEMHSYRVYSVRDGGGPLNIGGSNAKPILMCFICKLSFGYGKSFLSHSGQEHGLELNEVEISLIEQNQSAILQLVGKKEVLISFLEPIRREFRGGPPPMLEELLQQQQRCPPNIDLKPLSQSPGAQSTTGMDLRKSPVAQHSNSSSSSESSPTPAYQQQNYITGTTIGVCPEHTSGRPSGLDCQKCELILNSSRLGLNQHTRNSCKTLKCPKCNWHYKYQETLEIHMKEKHPETETSCVYCIASQPHPRLARGETYTCGYKPYRCEVCNYSTTTKGNLSIHMQSDKHLNNMQELQQGVCSDGLLMGSPGAKTQQQVQPPPLPSPVQQQPPPSPSPSPRTPTPNKPRPSFRCDVCNYETNVARNLRIHMTSEKHTHNMCVLQQNVKHMQHLQALQLIAQNQGPGQVEAMAAAGFLQQLQQSIVQQSQAGQGGPSESELADIAYNQALLIQMLSGQQQQPPTQQQEDGLAPSEMDPPPEPPNINPTTVFQCCICNTYGADSLEALNSHINVDRTKDESEILLLLNNNYNCKLCNYKTNLKANFQLHCKTDKHIQRLQHLNHLREGGREWRGCMVNPIQLRCNVCDYYSNSMHKMQVHAGSRIHEAMVLLLNTLMEMDGGDWVKTYYCTVCGWSGRGRLATLQHARSPKHSQLEQLHPGPHFRIIDQEYVEEQPCRPGSSSGSSVRSAGCSPGRAVFTGEKTGARQLKSSLTTYNCPYCEYTAEQESILHNHIMTQHSGSSASSSDFQTSKLVASTPSLKSGQEICPLCQQPHTSKASLEHHVIQVHNVSREGLQRLLQLVKLDGEPQSTCGRRNRRGKSKPTRIIVQEQESEEDSDQESGNGGGGEARGSPHCTICNSVFSSYELLFRHQLQFNHFNTKIVQGQVLYSCWGCLLQFQNGLQVQQHYVQEHVSHTQDKSSSGQVPGQVLISERHVYKYRCNQCSLAFKTLEKLQVHTQYHTIRDASKCSRCGKCFRSVQALERHECQQQQQQGGESDSDSAGSNAGSGPGQQLEDYLNTPNLAEDNYNDPSRKYKCHRCKLAFTRQSYLTSHNKTLLHRKGEKLNYPLEKFLDPNRPYKCEVCKESFTQKNILLVHFNSVSHLHKLKNASSSSGMGSSGLSSESSGMEKEVSIGASGGGIVQQQQQQQSDILPQAGGPTTPLQQQPPNQSSSITSPPASTEDDLRKPYRCNICRVAYTQGSTLDIHMRSVLHQTRASKVQDLVQQQVEGQVLEKSAVGGGVQQQVDGQEQDEQNRPGAAAASSDEEQQPKQITSHKTSLYKHILQSYGFEVAMHYNEYNTGRLLTEVGELGDPELVKSECSYCGHVFSSIWILKSHLEEVHSEVLDFGLVEEYAGEFRAKWEEKKAGAVTSPTEVAPIAEPPEVEITPSQQELQLQDLIQQMSNYGSILNPGLFLAAVAAAAQQQQQQQQQQQPGLASLMMMPPGIYGQELQQQMMGFNPFQQQREQSQVQGPPFIQGPVANYGGGQDKLQELLNKEYKTPPQQQHQQQQVVPPPQPQPQQPAKRARTRITDDQLKVLRAHFDINNSPSEEQINNMAMQSGLPPKVIKHWFRNTLFKERQRNKDSPYNFSNPPSTTLNLEEYEKTGEARVGLINVGEVGESTTTGKGEVEKQVELKVEVQAVVAPPPQSLSHNGKETHHGSLLAASFQPTPQNLSLTLHNIQQFNSGNLLAYYQQQQSHRYESESEEEERPAPNAKKGKKSKKKEPDMLPPSSTTPNLLMQSPSPSPTSSGLTTPPLSSSNSISGLSSGKRANRTRFTDYQIKVLQEFFENNAYPKDDDLEYLSKLLGLSPRVIVVWFQNARQKARKVYENQPPTELPQQQQAVATTAAGEENRFQRTPGLNYQCKKCLLVFQRYYELIRHQKTHCFKEEDAKRSAQAQAAAAQVACKLNNSGSSESGRSESSGGAGSPQREQGREQEKVEYNCDKCGVHLNSYETWREHQLVHLMGQHLPHKEQEKEFPPREFKLDLAAIQQPTPAVAPPIQFMYQQQPINLQSAPVFKQGPHQQQQQQPQLLFDQLSNSSNETNLKRKYSTEDLTEDEEHLQQQPRDKRLRTTILPEQLDYLYQKYQLESNPSRKMLEQIAREVNLKKRVVQVWFQNTRARERKGQYRAHSQVINKKCPYCSAIFKVKSALESHLISKHGEEGVDVDGIEELPPNSNGQDMLDGGVLDLSGKRSYGMMGHHPDSDCYGDEDLDGEEDDSL